MLVGKNILFLLGNWELGGAERQALLLARHLQYQEGAMVEVWGFGKPGRASTICEEWGISWKSIHLQLSSSFVVNVFKLLPFAGEMRRAAPDVLLPYTWFPNVLCGLIWRFVGCQISIWNQRDSGISLDPARALHRLAVQLTPFFISNSFHAATFLADRFNVDQRCLTVIPNGVSLPPPGHDRASWRFRLGVNGSDFVGCMVANFSQLKDHATAVKAWRMVVNQFSTDSRRAMLVLAGRDDGTANSIRLLIHELNLDHDVCILDSVDDVTGLLASCDVAVHCSEHEGCPNAILEAMAVGCPVVASDNNGTRMVLGAEGKAFLAPFRDPEGIAKRILMFAKNSYYRAKIGEHNRQRILDNYSADTMCSKTVLAINSALNNMSNSLQ